MKRETAIRRVAKPVIFAVCLIPLAWIALRAIVIGDLGANPVETVNRFLGDWAMRLLIVTLMVSPLVHLSGSSIPVRFRRMLGLFAFFYATLHIANYVVADQFFNWADIWADIVKRNFITVGMLTFIILLALAVTSPKAMIKRLGGKRWRRLHQTVYIAAIGSVFHYIMMIKADFLIAGTHGAVLAGLLIYRVIRRMQKPERAENTRRRTPRPLVA